MPDPVFVLGGARTDFKRNFKKEGKTLRDAVLEPAREALARAGIEPADVQAGIVGNFAAGLYTRQLHLGALLCELDESLRGIPTLHVEAACASGSLAVLTAAQWVMAGLYDCVLVVGAEQQKTMPPVEGADVLAAAADYHREKALYGDHMFPKLFGRIAELYMQRYPLTEQDLAWVGVKNYAHARLNPLAQMRDRPLDLAFACAESTANWRVGSSPLKLADCSQISDGGAAVVVCSRAFAERRGALSPAGEPRSGGRPAIRLLGWGHATDRLAIEDKDVPHFPPARRAVARALQSAGTAPRELHGIEVHDCFSISELVAYEVIGLTAPGTAAALLATGATMLPSVRKQYAAELPRAAERPFSIPVNAGGGLMADGHPVGATGVRQVLDAFEQLNGLAADRQIEGAARFLTYNVGGSMTTTVAMVWGH